MYQLEVPHFPEHTPWDLPLLTRIQMLRAEHFRVAYYHQYPDNPTFQYRCFNMAQTINSFVPGVSAAWFWEADESRLLELVKEIDVLVVGRVPYTDAAAQIVTTAKRLGVRVLYEVDDYVFNPQLAPLIARTLGETEPGKGTARIDALNFWFAYSARIQTMMNLADGFIVSTADLADRVREQFNDKPIFVVPNFMFADQLEVSNELVAAKQNSRPQADGRFGLGYFSGTNTHNRDFAIAAPALAQILQRHPEVTLRLGGLIDIANTPVADFTNQIEFLPFVNYLELQRYLAETEVNLAPLIRNQFTNAKSEIKYFTAGAVATPTLASPTITISAAIKSGANGILVKDQDWEYQLEQIIENYQPDGVAMGQAARAEVLAKYTPAAQANALAAALSENQIP